MKYSQLLIAIMATTLVVTGCKKNNDEPQGLTLDMPKNTGTEVQDTGDPNQVVAAVGDKKMIRREMSEMVENLLTKQNVPEEQMDEARQYFNEMVVRSFVLKNLLLDEASKQDIKISAEEQDAETEKLTEALKAQKTTPDEYFKNSPFGEEFARKEFTENIIINKLVKQNVLDKIEVTQAEIDVLVAQINTKNAEIEEANQNLEASHKAAKEKITDLKKQLDAGADFAALAKENSDCPSGAKGGDLGEFTRGQMVKPFEDAAFSQKLNKVGEIVESPFGYHLIKVSARTAATEAIDDQPAKPESVSAAHILIKTEQAKQPQPILSEEEMTASLKDQKSREAVGAYLEKLKDGAQIESIFELNI